MIEPIIGDKQCRKCFDCKPRTEFSAEKASPDGLHYYCKACRREQANRRNRECPPPRKRKVVAPKESPTAWLVPADPRNFTQKLAAATQHKHRHAYPVEPAQLRWCA